jgi:hypothetical protein
MMAIFKTRISGVILLLLLVFATLMGARAADAPLYKVLRAPSSAGGGISLRLGQTISRQEIFKAIQAELERMGISGRGDLRPEDLGIQTSVPANLLDSSGLRVEKAFFDPQRRQIVLEVRTSPKPRYLPFEVTIRRNHGIISELAGKLAEAGAGVQTESHDADGGSGQVRPKLPFLARPGTAATLIMLGENVRITTTVVPLQPGAKGQSILVRDLSTAQVMAAEVVAENLVQARF